jgi:serine protease Do
MAIYRIKRESKTEQPEYWQQTDPAFARDLDFDEIEAINAKYADEDAEITDSYQEDDFQGEPRINANWLRYLAPIGLVIVVTFWLSFSFFGTQIDWGMLAKSGRLAQDESLAALRDAVVTISSSGSSGTGFNIAADGLIITNSHVVADGGIITIRFGGEARESFTTRSWAEVEGVDLAVIDIDGADLPYVKLSNTAAQEGDSIIFIGNPLGYDWTISEGEISGLVRLDTAPALLIEGPVKPGSSGSPVFNDKSEVIGIIFARLLNDDNYGLAIPISYLTNFLEEIYEH